MKIENQKKEQCSKCLEIQEQKEHLWTMVDDAEERLKKADQVILALTKYITVLVKRERQ
jgi:hypothetical protein